MKLYLSLFHVYSLLFQAIYLNFEQFRGFNYRKNNLFKLLAVLF